MKYSVGIDLGGTNIGAAVIGENGQIVYKCFVPVASSDNIDALLSQIAETVKQSAEGAGKALPEISFVGIGVPGVCRCEKGPVIFAPNIFWHEVSASEKLEDETGLPVFLGNDADCAAFGEYRFGSGKDYSSMLMLTLGTGVGGAFISGGNLSSGFGAFGGEFGHISLVHGGVQCNCGKKGCFEAYCSAVALKRQTREAAAADLSSKIWELCGGDLKSVGGRTAFDAAELGDETAAEVVEQYISYLADGISGLINIFRPAAVIIGGGVSNQGESLFEPLNEKVQGLCYASESIAPPPVIKASLGNTAGIIGAGMLGF